MEAVRVRLEWIEAETKEDRLDHQITLDCVIDPDTMKIVGRFPIFGLYGSPVGEEAYPLILRADGRIDLGANSEIQSRFAHFNIREKRILTGEIATYTDDEEWCCKIVAVTRLAELAAQR